MDGKTLAVVAGMAMSLFATPAFACATPAWKYDLEVYAEADIVIRARVIGYRFDPIRQAAHFDLEVVEALHSRTTSRSPDKGSVLKGVFWVNSTFETPREWKTTDLIVGVNADFDSSGKVSLALSQQSCNSAFIMADTARNRQIMRTEFATIIMRRSLERARRFYEGEQGWERALADVDKEIKKYSILGELRPDRADY